MHNVDHVCFFFAKYLQNTSSQDCSGNGDFVCGVCECHEGW